MTLNVAREAGKSGARKFDDFFRPPFVQGGGCVFCAYGVGGHGLCARVTRAAYCVPTFQGMRDLCVIHAGSFFVPRCGVLPRGAQPAAATFYAGDQAGGVVS